jgi:hypothetical protein
VRASASLAVFAVAALLAALLAACGPGPTVSGPTGTATTSEAPFTANPIATPSPGPSLPSQTDTAWGRIWDALPPSFPLAPNSHIATDTGAGPSSGQLDVAATRDALVQFYRGAFRDAGYSIGTDGPLEDGNVVVTATDGYQCRIQLSVRATGAQESMAMVLYGAGCPFE